MIYMHFKMKTNKQKLQQHTHTVHNFPKDKEPIPYCLDGPMLSQFAESCVVDV